MVSADFLETQRLHGAQFGNHCIRAVFELGPGMKYAFS